MTDTTKKARGKVARYGTKENPNSENIAKDLADLSKVSSYYIDKLVDMGLVEIRLTHNGDKFLDNHKS